MQKGETKSDCVCTIQCEFLRTGIPLILEIDSANSFRS
jgi:hypothetical protein